MQSSSYRWIVKNVANILTGFRILGSVLLLVFPVFSEAFYSIYLLCGFSDMLSNSRRNLFCNRL